MKTVVKNGGKAQRVRATYDMDTETFAKHFSIRHSDSLAGMTHLPAKISYEVELSYRKFHERLHATRPRTDYDHEHTPDPPEAAIEWSLLCLQRNKARGWYEIAGCDAVVSYWDGDHFATRIDGVIVHHDDIPDAVDRLLHGD
jgi:hypothetical protein